MTPTLGSRVFTLTTVRYNPLLSVRFLFESLKLSVAASVSSSLLRNSYEVLNDFFCHLRSLLGVQRNAEAFWRKTENVVWNNLFLIQKFANSELAFGKYIKLSRPIDTFFGGTWLAQYSEPLKCNLQESNSLTAQFFNLFGWTSRRSSKVTWTQC